MTGSDAERGFSARVLVLFVTQLIATGLGVVNGLLTARLLGPAAKGDYALVVMLPALVMVLIQLGLPQALGYYTARSHVIGIVRRALGLNVPLSSSAIVVTVALLPVLQQTIVRGPSTESLLLGLMVIPVTLNATFMTGIVLGRQAVRWSLIANAVSSIALTALIVTLVGILGLGLTGAIVAFLIGTLIQSTIFLVGAIRVTGAIPDRRPVSVGQLLRYGLSLYPGTLTSFFNYRLDIFIIAWLLPDPSAPLGYYSMAVSIAEMVFFLPNSVATLFFPRVAGTDRETADASLGPIARITLVIAAIAAIAVIPASILLIAIVLPAFGPSLAPLFILLPGVVALSVGNVASGYLAGVGRTALVSTINIVGFTVNVAANIVLIPLFDIRGAAAASLLSYSLTALASTIVASRLSGRSLGELWLPRPADIRTIVGRVRMIRSPRALARL